MIGILYIEWAGTSDSLGPGLVRDFKRLDGWLYWSGYENDRKMSANLDHVRMFRIEPYKETS